jgi:hypothetical protein
MFVMRVVNRIEELGTLFESDGIAILGVFSAEAKVEETKLKSITLSGILFAGRFRIFDTRSPVVIGLVDATEFNGILSSWDVVFNHGESLCEIFIEELGFLVSLVETDETGGKD